MADYTVSMAPEEALERAFHYFQNQWPYRGLIYRDVARVWWLEHEEAGARKTLLDSFGGLLVFFFLSVITAFVFSVVYVLYLIAFKDRARGHAEVFATPHPEGTLLTVSANEGNFKRELRGWVAREFR